MLNALWIKKEMRESWLMWYLKDYELGGDGKVSVSTKFWRQDVLDAKDQTN